MKKTTRTFLLAAGLTVAAAAGQAATLGLDAGAPLLTGTGEVLYAPGSDLSAFGASDDGDEIAIAVALTMLGGLDPAVTQGAFLFGSRLSGRVTDLGFEIAEGTDGGDRIEMLFAIDGGDLSGTFSGGALAVLTGEFGTDDSFAANAFFSTAAIEISALEAQPSPVPLPAGALLLVSGLGALGVRRRGLLQAAFGSRRERRNLGV